MRAVFIKTAFFIDFIPYFGRNNAISVQQAKLRIIIFSSGGEHQSKQMQTVVLTFLFLSPVSNEFGKAGITYVIPWRETSIKTIAGLTPLSFLFSSNCSNKFGKAGITCVIP